MLNVFKIRSFFTSCSMLFYKIYNLEQFKGSKSSLLDFESNSEWENKILSLWKSRQTIFQINRYAQKHVPIIFCKKK